MGPPYSEKIQVGEILDYYTLIWPDTSEVACCLSHLLAAFLLLFFQQLKCEQVQGSRSRVSSEDRCSSSPLFAKVDPSIPHSHKQAGRTDKRQRQAN